MATEQTSNLPPQAPESRSKPPRPRFPWLAKLWPPLLGVLGLAGVLAVVFGLQHLRSGDGVDFYFNRGSQKFQQKDYEGAIDDFSKVIELDAPPDKLCLAYNNRGLAKGRKKLPDLEGSIADFNEAIRINSNYADAYNNRGVAWRDKHEFDKAVADFDQAIKLKADGDYYSNRALAKYKREGRGDMAAALADCEQAMRVNSRNAEAYKVRCLIKVRYNKLAWAQEDLAQYYQLMPDTNEQRKMGELYDDELHRPRLDPKEVGWQ